MPTSIPAPAAPPTATATAAFNGTPAVAVAAKSTTSDGWLVVTLRANGDPESDSVATMQVSAATTAADVQAWVAAEKTRVANHYTAFWNAHAALATAAVVAKRSASNGAITVTLQPTARAAGVPASTSEATMYVTEATTAADVAAWLTTAQAAVDARHTALQSAAAVLDSIS